MPSNKQNKKSSKSKVMPVAEAVVTEDVPVVTTPTTTVPVVSSPPRKEDPKVLAKKTEIEEEPHFDVAQNVYGNAKNIWAWGKTVPVISNLLGITEAVATKVLDTTVHMDLPAIDQKAVVPQLKRLDNDLVTPVIIAVWKIIEPAVAKGDEMVVKPMVTQVIPRVIALAPMALFDGKKREEEKRAKVEEEKESMIDASPTPEVIPALN